MKKIVVILFSLLVFLQGFAEDFVITYRAPESKQDTRFDYPLELIKEAMEKTKEKYGEYKLIASPKMNFKRASNPKYIATLNNFLFETSVSKEREEELLSVKIPIAKGIYGYRVFLINKEKQAMFDKIETLEDLKKISIGQGKTWLDVGILEKQGFEVIKGNNYEGLFKMVTVDRFDAFARGINEAFQEQEIRKDTNPKLAVENGLCLYYPLPRYFYTAKENTLLGKRLTEGLEIMIEDGSFDKIWRKFNYKFIEQSNLSDRKIFRINNEYLPNDVPLDNKKLWYYPE